MPFDVVAVDDIRHGGTGAKVGASLGNTIHGGRTNTGITPPSTSSPKARRKSLLQTTGLPAAERSTHLAGANRNYTDVELGYSTGAHGRILSFANRDEEAVFWNSHDVTEFVGEECRSVEVTIGG